ncbi:hypothetical protein D3C87_2178810 [compost metagenome]
MSGREVFRDSPQVMSKSADTSKKKKEMLPEPFARQGVGPSSENFSLILNTPMLKIFSETEADTSMMK